MEHRMEQALSQRKSKGSLRRLWQESPSTKEHSGNIENLIDFSSNDYLGLASDIQQVHLVHNTYYDKHCRDVTYIDDNIVSMRGVLGATGSRLLSGDSSFFHSIEQKIATYHNRGHALLFNSGYDANLSIVSCLPCDVIIYDEYCHNSLHMGIRLWKSYEIKIGTKESILESVMNSERTPQQPKVSCSFQHNSPTDLAEKLMQLQQIYNKSVICIVIESVYSMDGDVADVAEILSVASNNNATVLIDEAHSLGVYGYHGMGVLSEYNVEHHPALLCSIHTFGKGAGCHGAVMCTGSSTFKQYIVNYAYPFIYSTALPLHSIVSIQCSYDTIASAKGYALRKSLFALVQLFRSRLLQFLEPASTIASKYSNNDSKVQLLPSTSPIQALMISGNDKCSLFCDVLFEKSNHIVKLFPIKSPTVPFGKERVRIVLHANNTKKQVEFLVSLIVSTLEELKLLSAGNILSHL